LLDTTSGFGKACLNLLVEELRLNTEEEHIRGGYRALARAATLSKEAKPGRCPAS